MLYHRTLNHTAEFIALITGHAGPIDDNFFRGLPSVFAIDGGVRRYLDNVVAIARNGDDRAIAAVGMLYRDYFATDKGPLGASMKEVIHAHDACGLSNSGFTSL